ncbi:NAD(P)H-binding protein [Bacillus sp. 2205SS5-2]|uniref:NAD(P)H-binding protein n=1 Tax=Bacillus sp. 2205SS5-2 TaxID=3109031 RepID=UPI0030074F49
MKSALVVGATGLVGGEVVNLLLESTEYESVTVLVRKEINIQHPKLIVKVIDFLHLETEVQDKYDDVFCCLGTTIKKAKTKEKFIEVDFTYPVQLAKRTKELGAKQFLVISAIGAKSSSPFFYSKVKGELEESLKKVNLPSLKIFRPSLLVGERAEFRLGEKMGEIAGNILKPFLQGSLRKYRNIHSDKVAASMYEAALEQEMIAVKIYESTDMQ